MRPDDIAIAIDWAAAEGWNPGLADAACFAVVDAEGFLVGETFMRNSRPEEACAALVHKIQAAEP